MTRAGGSVQSEKRGGIGLLNEKYTFGKPRSSNLTVYWHEYEIEHSIYKDTLLKLFSDCPAVAYQIFDVEYDMRSLTNVTKEYINQTCTGEKCITYERDLRKMKDRVGFYSGVQLSKIYYSGSAMQSSPDVAFPFGLLYNIPLSQLSQKLSFQAELSGRYLNYSSDYVNLPDNFEDLAISTWLVGIPMLFRYTITQRKFSPYLGLGKEWCLALNPEVEYTSISGYSDGLPEFSNNLNYLYRFQKGGWFFDAGINYEINPYYSLFVNLRFQRTFNKIIGEKHQNNFTYKNAEGVVYSSDLVSLQVGFMFR